MKGLDTVESLSAGAAWLKVWYPYKNIDIICIAHALSSILSFLFWIFAQLNAAVVTSSKNHDWNISSTEGKNTAD